MLLVYLESVGVEAQLKDTITYIKLKRRGNDNG